MLRAQRTVFVIWNVPAPGTTVGRVNLQNVPDKVKKLSNVIIPDAAKAPVLASQVASLPVFSLGTPPARPPTPPTPTPGGWIAVDAGERHTCGIRTDGTVACWGSNTNGHGTYYGQADPPAGAFTAISAGRNHSCGVRTDGTIECWGADSSGQLQAPAGTFQSVSAGFYHTCGIRTDATVACWGSNTAGQADPLPGAFNSISASFDYTCGVRTDGTIECWGDDDSDETNPPAGTFISVSSDLVHILRRPQGCGRRLLGHPHRPRWQRR